MQDCGPNCNSTNDAVNQGTYFGCDGTGCYDGALGNCGSDQICMFTVATSAQVSNPIASFASYNNGVSISLPSVASSGSSAVTGTLTLGISSPTPSPPLAVYLMDPTGATDNNYLDFDTTFNGTTYGYQSTNSTTAFLDSGSNAFYFPSALTVCSDDPYFYCPSGTSSLSATIAGYDGSNSTSVSFSVANGDTLLNSSNSAFNNLGGPMSGSFDWGLPFFYNRTIYVGINGTSSYLNGSTVNGPFWAF